METSEKQFTREDAEAAGWIIVHEAIDAETEGVSLNATVWRAEKYLNQPGRAGTFVEAQAHTEEGLYAAIAQRENQFAPAEETAVIVPAEGVEPEDVDTSDESTIERITAAELAAARQNDVLTVLSDPSDPDSEPEQKVIQGGQEVAPEDYEVDESLTGNAEVIQPAPGEATDASDAEQRGIVPPTEAATDEALQTNQDDGTADINTPQAIEGETSPGEATDKAAQTDESVA